jgi:hypothetical protein
MPAKAGLIRTCKMETYTRATLVDRRSRPIGARRRRTSIPLKHSERSRFVSTRRDYSDALNGASRNPRIIKRRRDHTYRSWAARHNASADAKT